MRRATSPWLVLFRTPAERVQLRVTNRSPVSHEAALDAESPKLLQAALGGVGDETVS
jgi:hypothetical protein